jgi:hypothetical protein
MTEVKINIANTEKRINNLKRIQQIMVLTAYEALHNLVQKWNRGYGGDNRKMDELREPYKSSKGDTGRAAIPNMNYSGNLHSAMNVKMSGGTGAVIYAHGQKENEKLRGNEEIRANLLQLSKDKTLVTRLNKMVSAALKK